MSNLDIVREESQRRKLDKNGYTFTELINNRELTKKQKDLIEKKLKDHKVIIWKGYTFIKLGENVSIFDYYTRRYTELKILQELDNEGNQLFNYDEIPEILRTYVNNDYVGNREDEFLVKKYIKHISEKTDFKYTDSNMDKVNQTIASIYENTDDLDLNVVYAIIKYNKLNYKNQKRTDLRKSIDYELLKYIRVIQKEKKTKLFKIMYNFKGGKEGKSYLYKEQAYKARKYANVNAKLSTKLSWMIKEKIDNYSNNKKQSNKMKNKLENTFNTYVSSAEKRKEFNERIRCGESLEKQNVNYQPNSITREENFEITKV